MATNKRTYYAIQALAFGTHGKDYDVTPTGFIAAHGLQNFGTTTSFNLDNVSEIGQIEIYESIEGIPNVELTAEKVLDGYPLLQHLASQTPSASTLNGRYNDARCNVIAAIYNQNFNAASGAPLSLVSMSGMYLSAINFNIPVDGSMTESVTLVGNNKVWDRVALPTGLYKNNSKFDNNDSPPGTGGVQRRENVNMVASRWPVTIPGISASGTNDAVNGYLNAHIQNVQVAVNLGRTELFELGRRGPYYRFATFPTEVTCSIEVTATDDGDYVNAYEETSNLTNEQIKIVTECGVTIDLGIKNKLSSVNYNGGGTDGANVSVTYNYTNFNSLTVTFLNQDFL